MSYGISTISAEKLNYDGPPGQKFTRRGGPTVRAGS